MLKRAEAALLGWLFCIDLLAGLLGWHGLRWGGRSALTTTLLLGRVRWLWRAGPGGWLALLVLALPALLLHLALASLRNRQLNPRDRLRPGTYPDRVIQQVNVPTPVGPVPALYTVPVGTPRAAVLVAHGSGSDKSFYSWELTDALVRQGIAVLSIDLEGHGQSPRPQAFPAVVESLGGALAWLRARSRRVGVVGISLGGCVAAHALAAGQPADALVLLASPPEMQPPTRAQKLREARALAHPRVLRQLRLGSPYHLVRAWTTTPKARARIGTWQLIERLDLCGSLHALARPAAPPLLLVYAVGDALVPLAQAERVRQAAPPQASFRYVGGSHLSVPIDPDSVQLVSAWLAEQL